MNKIICPHCGTLIEVDPFDENENIDIERGYASAELHYDCPHCGHWFTAYVDAKLVNVQISYRKDREEED